MVLVVKNLPANVGDERHRFSPWVRKVPWSGKWQPAPVFLPGKFYAQKSLAGYSPWDHRVRHDWVTKHTHTNLTTSPCEESSLGSFYSLSWPFMYFTICSYFINLLTNFLPISPSGMKVSREDSTWLCHLISVSLFPHGVPATEYAVTKT